MKKSVKKYGAGGSAKSSSLSKYQMKGEVKKNDPIPSGMAARKKAQEQANADKIKKGIDSVVKQTPAQARAFDKKKSKQNTNYNNSMSSWLDSGAKPNFGKGMSNAAKNLGKSMNEAGESMRKSLPKTLGGYKKTGGSVKKKK
jgi:hypothetical protein